MKINSHNSYPISPSIIMRSNPSLVVRKNNPTRSCTSKHNPETNKKRRPSPGRHVELEPVMVLTPVMTSKRTARNTPERPRFHPDDINDVCAMMQNLFLTKEDQRKDCNQASNGSESKQTKETMLSRYGRVTTAVQDQKTKETVEVFRSARLASNKKH
jgi:hypothetical protein